MPSRVALSRLRKELDMLHREPPPGISAWAKEDGSFEIEAGESARPHPRRPQTASAIHIDRPRAQ